MNRGHVDQEASRQGNVTGNARTLLAERLFGNLDDNFLAGLQHFGDELRTARRGMPTVVMASTTGAAAFESPASTITATAVPAPATIPPAEGPLEARARVAADASGITRIIFPRNRGAAAAAGRASFARE